MSVYGGVWEWRRPLGLVAPAANLAYIHYPGPPAVQRGFYWLFWPLARLSGERHVHFDRSRDLPKGVFAPPRPVILDT